jgi:CRISPR/Cas system-associated protein Csm6
MGVTTTVMLGTADQKEVEEHYKMGITTTGNFYDGIVHKVEEIYKTNITTTKDQNEFYFNRDVEELYNQHTNG